MKIKTGNFYAKSDFDEIELTFLDVTQKQISIEILNVYPMFKIWFSVGDF